MSRIKKCIFQKFFRNQKDEAFQSLEFQNLEKQNAKYVEELKAALSIEERNAKYAEELKELQRSREAFVLVVFILICQSNINVSN